MSRDYARTKDTRKKSGRYSRRSSANFTWLIIGVIFGLVIAGLGYLKQRVTVSVQPQKTLLGDESPTKNKVATHQASKLKADDAAEDKVHFDFYTILPSVKVANPNTEVNTPPHKTELPPTSSVKTPAEQVEPVKPMVKEETAPPAAMKNLQDVEQGLLSPAKPVAVASSPLKPVTKEHTQASHAAEKMAAVKKPVSKETAKKTQHPVTSEHTKLAKPAEKPLKKLEKPVVPVVDLTEAKPAKANTLSVAKYIVQIAAFKHYEDADHLKALLILAGYDAKIKVIPLKGINWHRVWLGPYPTAQAAEKIQQELATKHTKSVVVKIK